MYLVKNVVFILCSVRRSSRPEVASVKPMEGTDQQCSHTAKVTALSTHPIQMTSVIFAEEEGENLSRVK